MDGQKDLIAFIKISNPSMGKTLKLSTKKLRAVNQITSKNFETTPTRIKSKLAFGKPTRNSITGVENS